MKTSQAVTCKVFASLLAFICTTFLILYQTNLPVSRALRVSLNRLAPGCTQSAEESKATVQTVFKGKLGLKNLSSADHSDPTVAIEKPQRGLLWVQRNETYKQAWGISMFHALHCLEMIRDEVDDRTRHQMHDAMLGRSAGYREHDHHREDHVHHCLAYIAQVSCSFGTTHFDFAAMVATIEFCSIHARTNLTILDFL